MKTVTLGIKDFRNNLAPLTKKGQEEGISYLVTVRNKPLFEVKPCYNNSPELDETQLEYYKQLEASLSFWNDEADDNIFAIPQ